jgi:outer membrane protein OmpA-like peptidoglycan-associated protein
VKIPLDGFFFNSLCIASTNLNSWGLMKITRALVALFVGLGLFVAPLTPANAVVVCTENGGGAFTLTLNEAPTPSGTVGVAYNQVITTDAEIALQVVGGTVAPGVNAAETGAALNKILISGTPTTAGSFNAAIQIVHATQTVTCSWAFVVNGAGGGGVIEQPLTVGDPVKGGVFTERNRITCTSTTFSVTPSRIRIYFTKNGAEIADDTGTNVTSVDVPSAPGAASLLLTEDLLDSTIGCNVYAKSGTTEKTATTSWGILAVEPKITRVMEIFEDVLRNGGTTIFDNPAVTDQVADGFVGGKFSVTGRALNSFTFSLVQSTGRAPGQTPTSSERAVNVISRSSTKATLQLPEVTSLGAYYLVARTTTKTINIPVNIPKPILTIANAKTLVAKNKFLLEGDKVYGNTYTTTNDISPINSATASIFKKEFSNGFKLNFAKNTDVLVVDALNNLKKLAKLNLFEVTITGYGYKGGTFKINSDLATARANLIAKTLTNAGLKNAKIIIQIEQFDTKYSRQAVVTIR